MAGSDWDSELKPPRPAPAPLEKETPQRRLVEWLGAGVLVTVIGIAGLLGWQELAIRSITATDPRLSTTADGAFSIEQVLLDREGWVYYHVTLEGAPRGRRIDVACEWIDPDSVVRFDVEYVTRRVDKTPWPTHCRHRFATDTAPGDWRVRLYVRDRLISESGFEVVGGAG